MDTSNISPSRIITIIISLIVIGGYLYLKWKRASDYVDSQGAIHAEVRQKENAYTERVKQDSRWPAFLREIQQRCSVTDGQAPDSKTYQVYYLNIMDAMQIQYEPNDGASGNASIYAFLKRKDSPKYLQYERMPNGEIVERKISGGQWYELFEKAV